MEKFYNVDNILDIIDKGGPMMYLSIAGMSAESLTGCTKVSVGSCIVNEDGEILVLGANRAIPDLCKTQGCLRIAKYGDNAKTHRNPDDCRAIHSEIDAICYAAKMGVKLEGTTIYVTRYPCESCARAIVQAGIKHVVFGRNQDISEETKQIFEAGGVTYEKFTEYQEDDTVV